MLRLHSLAVVLHAVLLRQRLPWAVALLVLTLAASPLLAGPTAATLGPATADSVSATLQAPAGQLPDRLPLAAIASAEAELESSRPLRHRPRSAAFTDSNVMQPRVEDLLHAAASEAGVRRARCRLQTYPLDPHLRLLHPGNAPPLA